MLHKPLSAEWVHVWKVLSTQNATEAYFRGWLCGGTGLSHAPAFSAPVNLAHFILCWGGFPAYNMPRNRHSIESISERKKTQNVKNYVKKALMAACKSSQSLGLTIVCKLLTCFECESCNFHTGQEIWFVAVWTMNIRWFCYILKLSRSDDCMKWLIHDPELCLHFCVLLLWMEFPLSC